MQAIPYPSVAIPAMSQYKIAIVQTFSTFCRLHGTRNQAVWTRDRALQQVLHQLVDDSFRATPEAWARYFLLSAQQDVATTTDLVEYNLQPLMDNLTAHRSELMQEIRVLYAQMVARQTEPAILKFLRSPNPNAEQFLSAYLQSSCWYSARHFYYTKIQPSSLRYSHTLEDCFQIVSEQASQPLKLLQNFQINQHQINLKTYAEKALKKILQNSIEYSIVKFESTWKLLRYLSKREVIKALELQQISETEIAHFALLWHCFKEIYQTKQIRQNRLPPPTGEQVQQICNRYSQRYSEFDLPGPISVPTVIRDLEAIAQAVRAYRNPKAVLSRIQQEAVWETPDPLLELIQTEQLQAVSAIAQAAFSELPDIAQKTLQLWFGLDFNHAEILRLVGVELGLQKQYQLSRRIKQYRIALLKSMIGKLNVELLDKLRNAQDTEKTMNDLLEVIDDYLSHYCKQHFYDLLEGAIANLQLNEKLLLYAYYQQHMDFEQLLQQFSLASDAILPLVEILVQFLRSRLQQWIQTTLDLNLKPYPSLNAKLNHFIEIWLQTDAAFNL